MHEVHTLLDKGDMKAFKEYNKVKHDEELVYLIGIDTCSYRIPCKTVLADRNASITKKRLKSKINMLSVMEDFQETK